MATILVVDDAAFMRMRMTKILAEAGYSVVQAENGIDAVEKYKDSRTRSSWTSRCRKWMASPH